MKRSLRIGVTCLARKTYDFNAAAQIYRNTIEEMKKLTDIEWTIIEDLVIEIEDAQNAAEVFSKSQLDGMVIFTGTFHLGHLALLLKRAVNIPTMLQAFNELPYDGGKIRLNSICGLNLNASNLYKAGYDDVLCSVGDKIDEDWLAALRMKSAFNDAHVGIIGFRADGFFNLDIDEMKTFRETGILIDHYEIAEVASMPVQNEKIKIYKEKISDNFDCSDINDSQRLKVAELCAKFGAFFKKHNLTAAAVRCWPEFANIFGIAPCAAMSILQSEGCLLGCEGDLEGVISMAICDAFGANTPFLADLSQIDFAENTALLWHCGVAPMNLWDGKCKRSLDSYFAAGRGVTSGFVLKEGRINLVRIDSARGKTRLFLEGGKVIPMEKQLTGTFGKVVFDHEVSQVLDRVTSSGVAHHLSLIYGEHQKAFTIFAKMMGYQLI
jgi:L-fucose isomerase-like protein